MNSLTDIAPPESQALVGTDHEFDTTGEIDVLWEPPARSVWYDRIKRLADIVLASVALLLLGPFFLLVAVAIKLYDGGPVFFGQTRVGLNGHQFRCFKIRTMVPNAEEMLEELKARNHFHGDVKFKLVDDPRITPLGRFLRKASMDETPQFWHVLTGDMSIVGPRPPVPTEVDEYTPLQRRRLSVKPGITCLWQVSGRSDLPFDRQIELDLEYINRRSFWYDLKMVILTVPAVCFMRGAY